MRSLALLLLSCILIAPRHAAAVQDQGRVIPGCYDVEMEALTPEVRSDDEDSLWYAPPGRVFFDSVRVGRGDVAWIDGYRELRVAEGALPSIHEFGWWSEQGDSVRLVWSDQVGSGLRALVAEDSVGFVGEAWTVSDYRRDVYTAKITLRGVPCDSPPRITALDQRQLLTSLSFSDGSEVALGASFHPGSEWEERTGERATTFVLSDPAIDFLGPVRAVEVWHNARGVLGRIDVHFLPTEDFDVVATKVVDEIGEPLSRTERTRDEVSTVYLWWYNRTQQTSLSGTRAAGEPWEIVLYLYEPPR